ncbi:MAG: M1 family metallopeptidase [Candidatus Krumholzibacteriota bacterium]
MRIFLFHLVAILTAVSTGMATGAGAVTSPEPSPAKCRLPVERQVGDPSISTAKTAADFPPPPAGDRGYDVQSYDLDLELIPDSRSLSGSVDIGLTALADGLTHIRLDLVDNLVCDGITFRGGEAAFTHQGDSLVVALAAPLATSRAETLIVRWHGRPLPHGNFNSGLMFRSHDNGTPDDLTDDMPMIANQNQPWSAHSWWPCKDHPADKALVSLRATVPDTLQLISNGTLLLEDVPSPGLRRFAWREEYPIAVYLVSLAATNYVSWSEECSVTDGAPVHLDFHVFPQDLAKAEIDLAPTCEMMDFMTVLAGPYPFTGEKYAQAEFKWFGSMEHQTATSLSPIVLTGDHRFELVVIHELAHQWFGDSLTPAVWADIWLNEGFARYFEALWVEHTAGPEAYRDFMRQIGPERHPELFVNDGVLSDPDPILPNTLIYDKGAWVLHLLRMLIGRPAFEEFLANYATAPGLVLGNVNLADMIAHAEAAAGRNLDGFFDPWLDTSAVPVLRTRSEPVRRGGSDHGVRVTFTQQQDPVFEMAVPVVVHTSCDSLSGIVFLTRREETFTWSPSCPVDSVSVDPEGLVLMRTGSAPPPVLQVAGPWPNPVTTAGAEFRIYLTSNRKTIAKLYDMRGRLIHEADLGTLAATGPSDDPASEPHVWSWPFAGGSGRLAAGVYWVEFTAEGARAVRKLTLLD